MRAQDAAVAASTGDLLAFSDANAQWAPDALRALAGAFAADPHAREVARTAVLERRFDLRLTPTQRIFLYLPFEHAEDAAVQNLSVTLFEGLRDHRQSAAPDGAISYAWRHRDVIQRFGRFPHRNAVLGRVSSPAEQVYLAQPGAGF